MWILVTSHKNFKIFQCKKSGVKETLDESCIEAGFQQYRFI